MLIVFSCIHFAISITAWMLTSICVLFKVCLKLFKFYSKFKNGNGGVVAQPSAVALWVKDFQQRAYRH